MADVLLITDDSRLQAVFRKAAKNGDFSLRIAPTLSQGEEEIEAGVPCCTFVPCSISGLDADSIASFLQARLPDASEIVVMSAGADGGGRTEYLDLSQDDGTLAGAIETQVAAALAREKRRSVTPPAPLTGAEDILFGAAAQHSTDHGDGAGRRKLLWGSAALVVVAAGIGIFLRLPARPQQNATVVTAPVPQGAAAPALPGAAVQTPASPAPPAATADAAAESAGTPAGYLRYTIRPGDNIRSVLVKRLGRDSKDLDRLQAEIRVRNNIRNFRSLKIGQRLLIPVD